MLIEKKNVILHEFINDQTVIIVSRKKLCDSRVKKEKNVDYVTLCNTSNNGLTKLDC